MFLCNYWALVSKKYPDKKHLPLREMCFLSGCNIAADTMGEGKHGQPDCDQFIPPI
jgi:hypothetical protein